MSLTAAFPLLLSSIRIRYIMEYYRICGYFTGNLRANCPSGPWDLDGKPVKGGLDIPRQRAAQDLVVEVEMQVRQDGAFGRNTLDPSKRFVDGEMARVALVAQCIDDPEIEARERGDAFRRQVAHVAGVCDVADAKSKRW